MSANSNLLDKLLDENNNWFGQIDSLSAVMMPDLPEPTFSFKSGHKQCADQADEPVICRLSNVNIASESQQQQQLTKQSVKRALFVEKEEIDHEANLKLVQKQLDQLITEDCERWNFDFKNNRPLNNVNSRYQWCAAESVLSKLDLNRSCTIEAKEESIKGSRPATSKTPQSAIRDNGKASDSISNNTAGKLSNSNSTNTSIATRSSSVKRKLMNIDGTCFFFLIRRRLSRLAHLLLILHNLSKCLAVCAKQSPVHASSFPSFII